MMVQTVSLSFRSALSPSLALSTASCESSNYEQNGFESRRVSAFNHRGRTGPRPLAEFAFAHMATCSDGDSFYLDADVTYDGFTTLDGCYSDSGYTNYDAPEYFRGGTRADGEVGVVAFETYGSTATWILAYYDLTENSFWYMCRDLDENDATLIHPTEITEWGCVDGDDYTTLDVVTTTCGCPTPSPTPGPAQAPMDPDPTPAPLTPTLAPSTPTLAPSTPTLAPSTPTLAPSTPTPVPVGPSSCGATESFRITSGGLPEVEGCFQATEESFLNPGATFEVWSVSGNTEFDQVVVAGLADDGAGEVSDSPYLVTYLAEVESDRILYCQSNEDAIAVHPVDATWQCDMSGNGSFMNVTNADISFECGCITITPAPAVLETPSPASGETESVSLWAVIGGSVGGAVLLAVVVGFVAWNCGAKKRNGNSGNPPPRGRSSPGVRDGNDGNYPVVAGGGAAAAVAVAGGKDGPTPLSPPPSYPVGPSPQADLVPASYDIPPPPAYSELPAYSG